MAGFTETDSRRQPGRTGADYHGIVMGRWTHATMYNEQRVPPQRRGAAASVGATLRSGCPVYDRKHDVRGMGLVVVDEDGFLEAVRTDTL